MSYIDMYNNFKGIKRFVDAYIRGTSLTVEQALEHKIVKEIIDFKVKEGTHNVESTL